MGLPSGVSTATVTFGTDADVLGVGATTTLTITPSHTLIWAATGEIIRAFSVSVDAAAGVVGSFAIPHTDQVGFTDELGNAITNWYYTVAGLVARSGETQPYRKVFQVASGVTSLNLDLIPVNGTVGAVGIAPQPVVLAVNGRTGAVVTAEVDGDGKLLESQVPERLSDANLQSTIGAAIAPVAQEVGAKTGPPAPNPVTWPKLTMISAVQAGHGFTSSGTGTFNLNDTSDFVLGTQSIKIVTNGAAANAQVVKTGLSLDMTNKGFLVWIKVSAAAYGAVNYINFDVKTDGSNYFRAALAPSQMDLKHTFKYGEWFPIFLNRANFAVSFGAPSWSNITQIQVAAQDRISTPVTVQLGGFATFDDSTTKYPNGVVSLTFDDSHTPLYLPKMSALGYAGTIYPIASLLDQPGYLTYAQANRMQNVLGWEIGAHATTPANHADYTTKTDAWVEEELQALRLWQYENNFRSPSFAFPIGPYTVANSDAVGRHFQSARGTGGGATSIQARPQKDVFAHRLPSYVIGAAVSRSAVEAWITRTVAGKGWLTLCFHDLVASSPTGNQWTVADFEALVDFIATSGIAVAPVGRVLGT